MSAVPSVVPTGGDGEGGGELGVGGDGLGLIVPAPLNVASSKSPYARCAPLRSSSLSAVPSVVPTGGDGEGGGELGVGGDGLGDDDDDGDGGDDARLTML